MSHTDTIPAPRQTSTHPTHTTPSETAMDRPTSPLTQRLITLVAWVALVLTIALPGIELLTSPTPTAPTAPSAPHTHTTPQTNPTPNNTHTTKADRAAAAHDGCRQTPSNDAILARPSCRSGMPITHDRGALQAPDTAHPGAHPVTPNEVPPSWADHGGAAAHSPHHHSRA